MIQLDHKSLKCVQNVKIVSAFRKAGNINEDLFQTCTYCMVSSTLFYTVSQSLSLSSQSPTPMIYDGRQMKLLTVLF